MKKIFSSLILLIFALAVTNCEYDNYDPPASFLSGTVTYHNVPVGVRSGATKLELWQYGFALRKKIDISIDQDGTFSARLFDGNYKLVRLSGAPWENRTDSIDVQIKGETFVNVQVEPYFIISGESFQKTGDEIKSLCTVTQLGARRIESLTLYIGTTNIVDANNNVLSNTLNASSLTDLNIPKSNVLLLSETLKQQKYIFVRLGVKATGIAERFYTPVKKIDL
ncbi:MAG: DUF3823 domain-containing protein [Prolixibacteraceae bacterium]